MVQNGLPLFSNSAWLNLLCKAGCFVLHRASIRRTKRRKQTFINRSALSRFVLALTSFCFSGLELFSGIDPRKLKLINKGVETKI